MDRSSKESSGQSDIEDIEESALHKSLTDNQDSEDETECSIEEETLTNESESRKDIQAFDCNDESISRYESNEEVELKDSEVTESSKNFEKSRRLSLEIKCMKETFVDNKNSNAGTSKTVISGLVSFNISDVIDVPTRQASASAISESTTISSSLTKSSEPLAIPSTSRDSSGLAPAAESSPKRPINFGRNVKQAIHVFHPTSPRNILQRLPIPIHSGRWVYLRDSPESSDYGGSPDSLDDPFLMEALDVKSPESEIEDMFTPRNEEMPSCPPPIQNSSLDSDSSGDEVGGAVGGLPLVPSHTERNVGVEQSKHAKQHVRNYSFEPGHIEGILEDISFANEEHTERKFENLLFDLDCMKSTIGDLLSKSVPTDLKSESGHSSRTRGDASKELGRNLEDTEDPIYESVMQGTTEDLHTNSGDIQMNIKDNPSESGFTEEKLSEDLASELSNIESDTVIEFRRRENILIERDSSEENVVENFDDTHPDINEENISPESQNADNSTEHSAPVTEK